MNGFLMIVRGRPIWWVGACCWEETGLDKQRDFVTVHPGLVLWRIGHPGPIGRDPASPGEEARMDMPELSSPFCECTTPRPTGLVTGDCHRSVTV